MEYEYNKQPIHAALTKADDNLHKVPAVRRCQFVLTQSHKFVGCSGSSSLFSLVYFLVTWESMLTNDDGLLQVNMEWGDASQLWDARVALLRLTVRMRLLIPCCCCRCIVTKSDARWQWLRRLRVGGVWSRDESLPLEQTPVESLNEEKLATPQARNRRLLKKPAFILHQPCNGHIGDFSNLTLNTFVFFGVCVLDVIRWQLPTHVLTNEQHRPLIPTKICSFTF